MSLPFENVDPRLGESGLFTQAELREFVESLPAEKRPNDSESLLQALVREKRLTLYQAKEIAAGRGNSLVFGNYVVLDKLGQGGMGVVYKAQHLRMQRVVALKVLSPTVTKDAEALRRFQREVVAAARLVHPNIVTAYDADEAKGTHFLVMEHVAGKNLAQIVRETGPLSVRQAVWCILQAARGLEFAHQHGVVHRDVKPANLLFDTEGKVKVLDLGLARLESAGIQQDADLTSTGAVMGTVDYMAPEQAEDTKLADARSDVYSLGMTLWYLITARMCFERDSLAAKIVAHRTAPIPSLHEARPEVPIGLDEVFAKLAAKDPRDRYQSMAEAILALEACLAELGEATRAMNDENELTVRLASITRPDDATVVFFKPNDSTRRSEGYDATVQLHGTTRVSAAQPEARRDRLPLAMLLAFLGGAAMILLTVFLLLPKGGGNVLIEVTDPEVKLTIDNGKVNIVGVVKQKLALAAGEHDLAVTRGETELAEKFTVGKGKATTLAIDVVDGMLQVKQDGKVLGSVALVAPDAKQPVADPVKHVLEFAPGSKVEIGSLQLDRTGALTLEAYVTSTDSPDGKPGVLLGTPQQFAVHLDPKTNRLSLESKHENGEHIVGPLEIAPGRRTHVAAVRSEQEHRLYVEGILVGRKKIDSPLVEAAAPVTIGGNFAGIVEEVRVSKAARYDAGFTPEKQFEPDGETLALYHAVEGKGEKLEDASGNKHDGTISGAKWSKADTAESPPLVPKPDSALLFNGRSSLVEIPSLELTEGSPLTLELWATCHDDQGLMMALSHMGKDGGFSLSTGGGNWGAGRFTGNEIELFIAHGAVRTLQRSHVAGVWDGTRLRFFFDGKETTAPFNASRTPPKIGTVLGAYLESGDATEPHSHFSGVLDEIRISKVARYVKEFSPEERFEPDTQTLALYHCDEGSGEVLLDSSGNNHHGRMVNVSWVPSQGPRNLLASLEPAKDGLFHDPADGKWKPGNWQLTPQGLKSGSARREIYRLPVTSLPPSYSLTIDFELAEGDGALLAAFTVGSGQCYLVVNGDIKQGQRHAAIGDIDGKASHLTDTGVLHAPCKLGERHVLTADIRTQGEEAELAFELDGKPLTGFKGKAKQLSIGPYNKYYDDRQAVISVGSMLAPFIFHRVELRPLATEPAVGATTAAALFDERGLTGWTGKQGIWKLENGELVGTLSAPNTPTFLWAQPPSQDFELAFQVKLSGEGANAGVQFRSTVLDLANFRMAGPQLEIGGTGKTGWGGYFGEGGAGGVIRAVPKETYEKLVRPDDYNDMTLRCVGQKLTTSLNGTTTIDGEFKLPDEGLLGFQLMSRAAPAEVRFRNLRFTDLSQKAALGASAPPPAIMPFDAVQARQHQEVWAAHLGVPVEYTNDIGMKFRLLPPGEFEMGSSDEQIQAQLKKNPSPVEKTALLSEAPQHRVRITKSLYVGIHEVSVGSFREFVRATGYKTEAELNGGFWLTTAGAWVKDAACSWQNPGWKPADDEPAVCLSLRDAGEFCKWLSGKDGKPWRVPTEAEWEFLARSGTVTEYSSGDTLTEQQANIGNGKRKVVSVGSYSPNAFGLYDVHGNVWEKCSDWHDAEYYRASPLVDPPGPPQSRPQYGKIGSINRGGGWIHNAFQARSATRGWSPNVVTDHGLRLVCDVVPPARAKSPFDAAQAKRHREAWAAHLGVPPEYTNSVGMKFALVPPGEFTMGSTPAEIQEALKLYPGDKYAEECIQSEAPQHKVVLTKPYYLGIHEVTQEQFEKVVGRNPSYFSPAAQGKDAVAGLAVGNHPVESVNWNDAAEFCERLSRLEGLPPYYVRESDTVKTPGGVAYRLPLEAEWEFACRAGTSHKFFTGDDDVSVLAAAWLGANSGNRSHAVGELSANSFGLFDMHGNVYEWCHDAWKPDYYSQFKDRVTIDPAGPSEQSDRRMVRGGALTSLASNARSSHRRSPPLTGPAAARSKTVGLRVLLPVVAVQQKRKETPPPAIAPFDSKKAKEHQETWAAHLGVPVELTNSIGMKFRLVPPGEFEMGTSDEQIQSHLKEKLDPAPKRDIPSEAPRHKVRISKPVFVGVHEVTVRDFRAFVEATGYKSEVETTGGGTWLTAEGAWVRDATCSWKNPGWKLDDAQPVVCVSHRDALAFCDWLSLQDSRRFRLPTEAEWEHFARAGTETEFSTGDALTAGQANIANDKRGTTAVGAYPPNPFGLHDIYGNAWEWCSDWFDSQYYRSSPEADPPGPASGRPINGKVSRVMRGGGWYLSPLMARSAYRGWSPVIVTDHGFRVVCDAVSKPSPPPSTP